VAVVRAEPAIQPPTNDALPSPSPDSDQELLSTGQRIIVLLPGQKEGTVLTISDDGTVEVPDLGPVQAAGQRPSDVEKAIAVGFFDRYVTTLAGAVRVNRAPP
jgi:protein involved in polysaccharide export with SLBB domain